MPDQQWALTVAALAEAVHDGWRAGATALWAAGRRREAVWLRADHRRAAATLLLAGSGDAADVRAAVRRCRRMAAGSARHPFLAAPWREAARALAVAAGLDRPATRLASSARHAEGRGRVARRATTVATPA